MKSWLRKSLRPMARVVKGLILQRRLRRVMLMKRHCSEMIGEYRKELARLSREESFTLRELENL